MQEMFDQEALFEEDTQHGRFLTFTSGGEVYGIEISYVIEIIGLQNITRVPGLPHYVKGIINLRGKIVPVVDIRAKFGKPPVEYDERTCIIVMQIEDIAAGFIVDMVNEVMNIQDQDIARPPSVKEGSNEGYVKGIGKAAGQVQLILDCEKLLDENMI